MGSNDLLGSIVISALAGLVIALLASVYWDLSSLAAVLVYGLAGAAATLLTGWRRSAAAYHLQRQITQNAATVGLHRDGGSLQFDRADAGRG